MAKLLGEKPAKMMEKALAQQTAMAQQTFDAAMAQQIALCPKIKQLAKDMEELLALKCQGAELTVHRPTQAPAVVHRLTPAPTLLPSASNEPIVPQLTSHTSTSMAVATLRTGVLALPLVLFQLA